MPTLRPALFPCLLAAFATAATAASSAAPGPAAASPPATPATPDLAASLGQMLFGLAVVIALLLACLWAIRRLSAPRGGSAAIKVLGAAAVGPRERVVLVALGEKVLVLGVAPGNIRTLHVMPADELPAASPTQAGMGGKDFSGWLKQAMERKNAP